MAQEDLTKITTAELQKKAKIMRLTIFTISIAMIIMTIASAMLSVKKGFNAITITAICFFPLVIIFSAQLKKINAELKSRTN
ncbi:hypothetical protein [Pedobacter sp. UBA4863]|uniref:hypothetical protein n=1 Tax=Pedobacter sp. UBA4863 TaxID=1947060 RepID=UPI0025D10C51|nr:hypothetical protein [Pedobacter sp. UBA4863]